MVGFGEATIRCVAAVPRAVAVVDAIRLLAVVDADGGAGAVDGSVVWKVERNLKNVVFTKMKLIQGKCLN